MQKLVVTIALTRFGVRRWAAELNELLGKGWTLESAWTQPHWFRTICFAKLSKAEE